MSKTGLKSLQLVLLFILCFPCFHGAAQIQDTEATLLLNLKQKWQNPTLLSHWTNNTSSQHCTWPEIACVNGSITGISVVNATIFQPIPSFICGLENLRLLNLSLNFIPGEFPATLYHCTKLQYLDLSQNYFIGQLPGNIDRLAALRYLNLTGNNFSGDIPAAIGRIPQLQVLSLAMNLFNGFFPPEIGNLTNLQVLELSQYAVEPSEIPPSFTRLKNLKSLLLGLSNLIGEIPKAIGEMGALEHLDLAENQLTGQIPGGLFLLKNLSFLYLYKNHLTGVIPPAMQFLNLQGIDLGHNNLTGAIPEGFGKLDKLAYLGLFMNELSGLIPESIGRLPNLRYLKLFTNNLSGSLPPDFGRYSSLQGFEVSDNRLTGNLPEFLCAGGQLVGLVAFNNNLSGELPPSLGNCSSLRIIKIHGNRFSGSIPATMWSSLNSSQLAVSDNLFSGKLPDAFSRNLLRLEIRNNRFFGRIPAGIASATSMEVFDAGDNLFTGEIPTEVTSLPRLYSLSLDGNQLSGQLPSEIISWESLTMLNLSRNRLSGPIPAEMGRLPQLTDLDLSGNQFSGQIPTALADLNLLQFNVSSNNLSGELPTRLENGVYENSFLNNPALCSSNPSLKLNLRSCYAQTTRGDGGISSRSLAATLSILAAVLLLAALIASIFLIRAYRRRKQVMDTTWKLTSFQRLNFRDADILSNLTEANLIGSGGSGKVYRAAVNSTGDVVAVKKIWSDTKMDQKLEKEFVTEVEILSSIRHSNIVKLLCCVYSDSSKLLVYEFMENRSLDQWLRRAVGRPSLDWPKRLHIAVGAAQGLCYMHHHCSPPIIHRDVKSSNILLDSEFNAKIADFGLARMLQKQGEAKTMSVVAGSFGYMAPEYAHTSRVSEKIDVFGFGVVLLELVTGRQACNGGEDGSLVEQARCHIQQGTPLDDALDEEICKEASYVEEMMTVYKLGVICTRVAPRTRPSMSEVLQVLLRCSHQLDFSQANVRTEKQAFPLLATYCSHRMPELDEGFVSIV